MNSPKLHRAHHTPCPPCPKCRSQDTEIRQTGRLDDPGKQLFCRRCGSTRIQGHDRIQRWALKIQARLENTEEKTLDLKCPKPNCGDPDLLSIYTGRARERMALPVQFRILQNGWIHCSRVKTRSLHEGQPRLRFNPRRTGHLMCIACGSGKTWGRDILQAVFRSANPQALLRKRQFESRARLAIQYADRAPQNWKELCEKPRSQPTETGGFDWLMMEIKRFHLPEAQMLIGILCNVGTSREGGLPNIRITYEPYADHRYLDPDFSKPIPAPIQVIDQILEAACRELTGKRAESLKYPDAIQWLKTKTRRLSSARMAIQQIQQTRQI